MIYSQCIARSRALPYFYQHEKIMNYQQLKAALQHIIENDPTPLTADSQTLIIKAALTAYQNARVDGLCHEGAYEIALQEIQTYLSKKATIAG